MEEQLISFETAKLAKEKGFDLITPYNYNTDKSLWDSNLIHYRGYPAPRQSLLQKWLREKHNVNISIDPNWDKGIIDYYIYTLLTDSEIIEPLDQFKTYEEALEAGLKQALTLI